MPYIDYLMRLPFAAIFIYHGFTKLFPADPEGNADMANALLGSLTLWTGLGIVEVLAGLAILIGGFTVAILTRLGGLAGAVVMAGPL